MSEFLSHITAKDGTSRWDLIENAARAAAQHVNGGDFDGRDFYSPEHREKWIEAICLAVVELLDD